jgi:hypothetical protein
MPALLSFLASPYSSRMRIDLTLSIRVSALQLNGKQCTELPLYTLLRLRKMISRRRSDPLQELARSLHGHELCLREGMGTLMSCHILRPSLFRGPCILVCRSTTPHPQ